MSRRALLARIGRTAGAAVMYQAMAALGHAEESTYTGPVRLEGAPRGASVLILGAGMAGLVAAYELSHAGYKVKVLEYNRRAGGRSWTLRGGDEYTELGGFRQKCEFDRDPHLYLNPGPWRIPFHHYGMLDYAKKLKVPLEPFIQVNNNAWFHSTKWFGGRPQRYTRVKHDYQGHIAELLGKAANKGALDDTLSREDRELLLASLRFWGALDKDYRYVASREASEWRGWEVQPGGGLMPRPVPSRPLAPDDVMRSGCWAMLAFAEGFDVAQSIFQPVGGMDRIAQALYREVKPLVQFDSKVTRIDQDERGVTVSHVDPAHPGTTRIEKADWCLCTIPLSILSQMPVQVGEAMQAAIGAVPYGASVKVGLQFKRRFWEEDERIYGGISYTDQPIQQIGYPIAGMHAAGKGVLLGAYVWGGPNAYEFTAMTPAQRVQKTLEQGARIHPQYMSEFENGIAVAWHRSPFTLGCAGEWSDEARARHYDDLCRIDGRIALAGEHASFLPAWQEGAVLSSLDAISRLHAKAVATAGGKA
ncbi:MAG: flavin monoamine oxidase family protein [Rudaea sp.]|uniref:flavin monoamine oxidase family protein n=1 Tax=Rudaea sp. TaxID=2136325 RepID=UPI0039E5A92B